MRAQLHEVNAMIYSAVCMCYSCFTIGLQLKRRRPKKRRERLPTAVKMKRSARKVKRKVRRKRTRKNLENGDEGTPVQEHQRDHDIIEWTLM